VARALSIGLAGAVLAAAASLALPYNPVYDPWGWLVWGRELAALDLSTGSGPSWKPLPVLVGAPLSLLGSAAPDAWLLIARGGYLAAPLLAAALAVRLAAGCGRWRWLAAGLAAASVALGGDGFTPPVRQFSGGLSEPLLVSLLLGAVLLALDRRPRAALWLGVAAALLRPECWPFLALWAWHESRPFRGSFCTDNVRKEPRTERRRPELRPHALAAALLVPLAWFMPDLLAAGDPLHGSETARQGGFELDEVRQVLGRALAAPLAAVWVGVALFALGRRDREEDRIAMVLLLAACAWVGLVAAMAVAGFAGLPRFLAPASAVFAVVGGVGLARAAAGAAGWTIAARPARRVGAALVALAVAGAAAGFGLRVAEVPGDLRVVDRQAELQRDAFALADRLGPERLFACGTLRVTGLIAQTALAWHLDSPIEQIRLRRRPTRGVAFAFRPLPGGETLGRSGRWWATQLPCAYASSASAWAIAGVSGTTR
jgi:hypothetical protein